MGDPDKGIMMNIILIIISGVLTAISFPTLILGVKLPNLGFLAWISLVPVFYLFNDSRPRKAFLTMFGCSAIFYSISLYWLYTAMNTFGKLPAVTSVGVLVLLIIFLSTYISIAPLLSVWVKNKTKIDIFWTLPIFWTAVEFARNFGPFNGFPWGNITNSQFAYLPIIQSADLFSVYGLTFIMVIFNLFIAELIRSREKIALKALIVLIIVSTMLVYGYFRLSQIRNSIASMPSISVAMLQGNIPQDEKWQKGLEDEQLGIYRDLTQKLGSKTPDLILWPEATYPYPVDIFEQKIKTDDLGGIKEGSFVLFGGLSISKKDKGIDLWNSAFLADSAGIVRGKYHKMHLVPFGEYVPYRKFLFFAKKLVAPVGNFVEGNMPFPLEAKGYKIGTLICYEDLFPEISKELVKNGAGILAVITNDAWYGKSSAAFQHLAISVFRAVETRRWMLRSANSGVSALVDPTGKILSGTDIFERGLIVSRAGISSLTTIYSKLGDFFGWGTVAAGMVLIVLAIKRRKTYDN